MNRSRQNALIGVGVIVIGLLIGGGLGLSTRQQTPRTVTVTKLVAARSVSKPLPRAATASPAPRIVAAAPIATPAPATTAPVAAASTGGWQIDETNTSVGTIVWSGVVRSAGGALTIDVRKAQVAGHAVGPCEQATHLRASLPAGAQSAPFQETNCSGVTSAGEMRVSSRSADGRTLQGSFWEDGAKVGDFSAAGR
ncbi:MAG TPA: hypothetical protein VGN14_14530 [Candidatus Elarobacter sp.]